MIFRYLVFGYDVAAPKGGVDDLIASYSSLGLAQQIAEKLLFDTVYIYDVQERKVVSFAAKPDVSSK